ncbi:hypothetical protein ATJ88_0547 [Isoptericola jiangsuensis]|uniref:Uncharacterized protein n=1 Tax=Isoptericola jiangsuensis TaxID=548579 RepID=A0A2A9EUR4_9MICO|nr:hypothetical protein [Isoptericola jiangsuensis]PFG41899.1 hypothetical protein ATJ88_0547 [Isoptericola jiangsuensis]
MWYLPELFEIDPTYATYTVALVVSGLLSIVASAVTGALSAGRRLLGVLLGVAMLGYGAYLYLFLPAEYWIAWYVFALPVLVVVNAVRAVLAARRGEGATEDASLEPAASAGGATFTDPVTRAADPTDGITPPTR